MRLGQTADEHGKRRGAFIKTLVDDHPLLAPMADIEPDFTPLISVCMELPPPAGYIDNLWITPWGGLALGEAKLVLNPQARREVVLDYARAVADWSYDDLEVRVRAALKHPTLKLWRWSWQRPIWRRTGSVMRLHRTQPVVSNCWPRSAICLSVV